MAKRKCEQLPIPLLPPCKRPLGELPVYSRLCVPQAVQVPPRRKRKLQAEDIPSPACERLQLHTDHATAESPTQSKKLKLAASHGTNAAADFQCQKDEAFREYNSFHFWRTPLPGIDLSELEDGAGDGDRQARSTGTDVLEGMDS